MGPPNIENVGIVGLGYVGVPLALSISNAGINVVGFDILDERIEMLNSGRSPIRHINDAAIVDLIQRGFFATKDYTQVSDCDAILICVPTPLTKYREPDLTHVINTVNSMSGFVKKGSDCITGKHYMAGYD